jgi:DegV family protein with EDD domain
MAYDSACQAKEMAADSMKDLNINILPSKGPALSQGFISRAAAIEALRSGSLDDVTDAAKRMMNKVNALAVLDTLHYLARGGRIPRAAAWAGFLLKIKPVLDATDDVKLIERCRSKNKAIKKMTEIISKRADGMPLSVNLMHANAPNEAQKLKADILSYCDCHEIYVTDFSPVIGAHTGPGSLGVTFYTQDGRC